MTELRHRHMNPVFRTAPVAVLLLLAAPALAQQPAPSSRTETYGDWTKRCTAVSDASEEGGKAWRCEMAQTVQLRNTGQTILQIALGRVASDAPISVVFQVPSTVWLRTPITLTVGDGTGDPDLTATYFRCGADACLADGELDDALRQKLLVGSTMSVSFADGTQRTVRLPVSLNGFADAFGVTFTADAGE